jgi:hypothetical protein
MDGSVPKMLFGLILSSRQCRDFGYAPAIYMEQLAVLDAERQGDTRRQVADLPPSYRKGKKCIDEEAVVAVSENRSTNNSGGT